LIKKKAIVKNVAKKLMVLVFVNSAIEVSQSGDDIGREPELGRSANMVIATDAEVPFLKIANALVGVGVQIKLAFLGL
jgi:hypothetical protein